MEQIRSFVAIEFPQEVKKSLKNIQDRLKSFDPSVAKWVDPQSIHLTLKFLGYVDLNKITDITRAVRDAVAAINCFEIRIDGLGCFPGPTRVQTIWVGLIGDLEKLQQLQKNLEMYIAPLGFPTEKRTFRPHLTLARVRESVSLIQRQALGGVIATTKIELNLPIMINQVSLMRSRLTPAGAIYSRLDSVALKSSCQQ